MAIITLLTFIQNISIAVSQYEFSIRLKTTKGENGFHYVTAYGIFLFSVLPFIWFIQSFLKNTGMVLLDTIK